MFPAHDKTWQFCMATGLPGDPNSIPEVGSYATGRQHLLFRIKQILVEEFGWTVLQSCGHDGSQWLWGDEDHWTQPAALVWGGSSSNHRSWIILRSPPGSPVPHEIAWELYRNHWNTVWEIYLFASLGFPPVEDPEARVFAGTGTNSAVDTNPGSTSQHITQAGNDSHQWCGGGSSTPREYMVHAMRSSDHKQQHILVFSRGELQLHWMHVTPERHQSSLSHPLVSGWMGARSHIAHLRNGLDGISTGDYRLRLYDTQRAWRLLYLTTMARFHSSNESVCQTMVRDAITGKRPIMDVGLVSETADHGLWLGTVPDMYLGQDSLLSGTSYHDHQWHHYGSLVLPGHGHPLVTHIAL